MKLPKFKLPKLFKSKQQKEVEKLDKMFAEGEIVLPTDPRDYEDIETFRKHLPDDLAFKLMEIEDGKK